MGVVEVLVWWASLTAVWLVLAPSPNGSELLVGAVAALPCAALAPACRVVLGVRWRFRVRWIGWVLPLLLGVVLDSAVLLTRALLRRGEPSRPERVELPHEQDRHLAFGRHAASAAVLASTPSTVVLDDEVRDGNEHLLVHPLGQGSDRLLRRVRR